MQAQHFCLRHTVIGALLAAAFMLAPTVLMAQSQSGNAPRDYYRAEFIILERLVDPSGIEEKMAGKPVEPTIRPDKALWVDQADGRRQSDLQLVPQSELHLNQAARRLENSGNYRVLAATGWYQTFPPNYDGEPLEIALGDWLPDAGQRAVEGHITIDRQRFLHVGIHLNHWMIDQSTPRVRQVTQNVSEDAMEPDASEASDSWPGTEGGASFGLSEATTPASPLQLVTWIRETRRMRSEEIHFIDSPTIGVLVFFKRVE
ncbi:CsiV family protein [Marinobacter sp.]|uniref:CsiV family protein n=1 Tax=Marinobacter sp. TaxID=50741 RepID=UPI00257E9DC5|nr:CsiV family protein [Marinobacter sp.]